MNQWGLARVAHTLLLVEQVLVSSATRERHHLEEILHAKSAQPAHTLKACLPNALLAYPVLTPALALEDAHYVKQGQLLALVRRNAMTARPEDILMHEEHSVNRVNPEHTPRQKLLDAQTAKLALSLEHKLKSVNCANQAHSLAAAQANALTVLLVTTPEMKEHRINADLVWEGPTQAKKPLSAMTALPTRTQNLVPRSV